jgi:hypothetical protein
MPTDVRVNPFRDLNHAWNPQEKREWKKQRQSHSSETQATSSAMNLAALRHAMNCGEQIFPFQRWGDCLRFRIGEWDERQRVAPIKPAKQTHLEGAERALVIVENDVRLHCGYLTG